MFLATTSGTTDPLSTWEDFLAKFRWQNIVAIVAQKALELLFYTILFIILQRVAKLVLQHVFKQYRRSEKYSTSRVNTMDTLVTNGTNYILFFLYCYALLSALGVPVGTLIAGAGVISLALGLGAQGFVSDVVTGFFIILEKQFEVGDVVQIDEITGTVSAIGIRTTQVTSFDGTLNFIPNRNISIVSNKSRGDMRVLIQIHVFPTTPLRQVQQIIATKNKELVPKYDAITRGPDDLGVTDLGQGNLALQVQMYVKNGAQVKVQNAFLSAYLAAIHDAGITLPTNALNLTKS
ncbi:MAG: mechanosensitive ion channel family protein [Schleiferilactobacillus harbinensis]|uniref:Small-conductance mechanosensitive channel n=1 Tax=Schleiferilactobacillus perolens DSM 12744 TaxID=1423792 RepID=A0A0R1MYA9_9LACO|nr:mechanosensitive ion channel family protein [Schleiferilactobacillus perolens]KRL12844.1 small-conductance mechanosensitive channel [Schleiferilactobacillus perolens DSM 12744]MCI1892878.1 mechanosensitive ion channel family protein [Schleiferilactobacillus harbinensis]MCI1911807.1 mechanosensitive ion channel family protein [Schleiferilactobacillus harbinensis]